MALGLSLGMEQVLASVMAIDAENGMAMAMTPAMVVVDAIFMIVGIDLGILRLV